MVLVNVVALTLIPTLGRLSCWPRRRIPQWPAGLPVRASDVVDHYYDGDSTHVSKQLLQQAWRTARTSRRRVIVAMVHLSGSAADNPRTVRGQTGDPLIGKS